MCLPQLRTWHSYKCTFVHGFPPFPGIHPLFSIGCICFGAFCLDVRTLTLANQWVFHQTATSSTFSVGAESNRVYHGHLFFQKGTYVGEPHFHGHKEGPGSDSVFGSQPVWVVSTQEHPRNGTKTFDTPSRPPGETHELVPKMVWTNGKNDPWGRLRIHFFQ